MAESVNFVCQKIKGHTHMLLPLIQLLRDERLAGLAKNPFLNELVTLGVVFDLQARRDAIHVLNQVVVEERRSPLDRVRHFGTIPDAGEQ